jgi:hypothetical protein
MIEEVVDALGGAFELANTALEYVLGRRKTHLDHQESKDAELLAEIVQYLPESFIETLAMPMTAHRFPSAMFDTLFEFQYEIAENPKSTFYDRDLEDRYVELKEVIEIYTDFLSDATPLGDGFHSIFNDPAAIGFEDDPDADAELEEQFQEGHMQVAEAYRDLLLEAREKCLDWSGE